METLQRCGSDAIFRLSQHTPYSCDPYSSHTRSHIRQLGDRTFVSHAVPTFVIPAAFSPRESGEGIQRLWDERHWVPAFAGTTELGGIRPQFSQSPQLCHCRESGNPASFVRTPLDPRFRGDDDTAEWWV